jgi:hypothetical protein
MQAKKAPSLQPVGLEGNRLQIRLAGAYFAAFLGNRTTIPGETVKICPRPAGFSL